MGMQFIQQDSSCRPASENRLGHEGTPKPEERAFERLIATTRADWLHGGRDMQGRSGDCATTA